MNQAQKITKPADPPPALECIRAAKGEQARLEMQSRPSQQARSHPSCPTGHSDDGKHSRELTHTFYHVPSPQATRNKTLNRQRSIRNIKTCLDSSFPCYPQRRTAATGFAGVDVAKGKEGDGATAGDTKREKTEKGKTGGRRGLRAEYKR